jgi:hypothetical protein
LGEGREKAGWKVGWRQNLNAVVLAGFGMLSIETLTLAALVVTWPLSIRDFVPAYHALEHPFLGELGPLDLKASFAVVE